MLWRQSRFTTLRWETDGSLNLHRRLQIWREPAAGSGESLQSEGPGGNFIISFAARPESPLQIQATCQLSFVTMRQSFDVKKAESHESRAPFKTESPALIQLLENNQADFEVGNHRMRTSAHNYLRICHLCQELGISVARCIIAAGRSGKLRPTLVWCLLCPLTSMVPVFWR
jgi:hypothetical protein